MVRHLLERGVSPHMNILRSGERVSALSEACRCGRFDVVDALLDGGADPRFPYAGFLFQDGSQDRNKTGQFVPRALVCAIRSGSRTMVKKLLARGASIEDAAVRIHQHLPGLVQAVADEDESMVHLLLSGGASFDWPLGRSGRFTTGDVALAVAIERGLESMVQFMARYGYAELRMDLNKPISTQYLS